MLIHFLSSQQHLAQEQQVSLVVVVVVVVNELEKSQFKFNLLSCVLSDCFRKPMLPCQVNAENEAYYDKTAIDARKVILSAMWFVDTAGVQDILTEFKPPANELHLPGYKPYTHIYRLCFSFHSSFGECVDFIQTVRAERLCSIALPRATSEAHIVECFYDDNGSFVGYHHAGTSGGRKCQPNTTRKRICAPSAASLKPLQLRKRHLFADCDGKSGDTTSESDTGSDGDDDDELDFALSDTEDKRKQAKLA